MSDAHLSTETKNLVLTEFENALDSFHRTILFAGSTDPMRWKWLTICLDHALYTAAISCLCYDIRCVLKGCYHDESTWYTAGDPKGNTWSRSKKVPVEFRGRQLNKEVYRIAWDRNLPPPKPQHQKGAPRDISKANVIGFWTAMARVQEKDFWMHHYVISRPLDLTDEDMFWLRYLHTSVRNPLVHCTPGQYSLPVTDVARACEVAAFATAFLLHDSLTPRALLIPEDQLAKIEVTYKAVREILKRE